jgi:NADH-quinone oxidoreductase subunit F
VEVPFGTTIGDIVNKIGGGAPNGGFIEAVQVGGTTGTYSNFRDPGLALDGDCFPIAGSIGGSGSIEVMTDDICAVEMADSNMLYVQTQSCGKCLFCREGTLQISEILKDIVRGEGEIGDLDLLIELSEAMNVSSLCGVGRSAASAILSSVELFRHEYNVHIREKKCPLKP